MAHNLQHYVTNYLLSIAITLACVNTGRYKLKLKHKPFDYLVGNELFIYPKLIRQPEDISNAATDM